MAVPNVEELLLKVEQEEAEKLQTITVKKELDLEFDIGNLLAFDKNVVDARAFRGTKKEDFLRSLARDNTQLLINEIWKLPTERVAEAIVAKLPQPTTPLPREKPAPKPRPPTKWEEFAKLKGIQKKKKTNLVWDEVAKQWKRRWGYKRAKDDTKEWLIEVPVTADPNEDQFQKRNDAKKERVAKNELNRLRNIARAQKIKVPGIGLTPTQQQSRSDLARAASVAKTSTASLGHFQELLPKEKAPKNMGKKRKFQPLLGDFSSEKQKQLDILKIMDSKRPKLDVTKAVNKQMREDDRDEAAAKYKSKGKKGRRDFSGKGGKGKGKGGKAGGKFGGGGKGGGTFGGGGKGGGKFGGGGKGGGKFGGGGKGGGKLAGGGKGGGKFGGGGKTGGKSGGKAGGKNRSTPGKR